MFISIGSSYKRGKISTSWDGITWTKIKSVEDTPHLNAVTYGNGQFVTVGEKGTILTLKIGTSWTFRKSRTSKNLTGVTHVIGLFVTMGNLGTILTSSDGTSWISINSGKSNYLGVTFGNRLFVTVGKSGTILTSSKENSWIEKTSGISNHLYGITIKTAEEN